MIRIQDIITSLLTTLLLMAIGYSPFFVIFVFVYLGVLIYRAIERFGGKNLALAYSVLCVIVLIGINF